MEFYATMKKYELLKHTNHGKNIRNVIIIEERQDKK
jgi:hypothetical protein